MGLKANVYGASINGTEMETPIKRYDLYCPGVCRDGRLNFWKDRCLTRIGNKNIRSCYRGCSQSAKHPELKAKMDAVKKKINESKRVVTKEEELEMNRAYNHSRYLRSMEAPVARKKMIKKDRAHIVGMYINGFSMKETCDAMNCGRTVISLFRKMYREKAMDENGNFILE